MDRLTIEAIPENTRKVVKFVNEKLKAVGCSVRCVYTVDIAIDEVFSNIARYAYAPGVGEATVCVQTSSDPLSAVITFMDKGIPYNPLEREDPDVTLEAEERKIGGLGIYIVKMSMDDVEYEFKDGQNILKIKKLLY